MTERVPSHLRILPVLLTCGLTYGCSFGIPPEEQTPTTTLVAENLSTESGPNLTLEGPTGERPNVHFGIIHEPETQEIWIQNSGNQSTGTLSVRLGRALGCEGQFQLRERETDEAALELSPGQRMRILLDIRPRTGNQASQPLAPGTCTVAVTLSDSEPEEPTRRRILLKIMASFDQESGITSNPSGGPGI